MTDYVYYHRDLEGNCEIRTQDEFTNFKPLPLPEMSEKAANQPAQSDSRSRSRGDASTLTGDIDGNNIIRGREAEKMEGRGRGESGLGLGAGSAPALERSESGRDHKVRGEEAKKMEGRGRGEGGLTDLEG